MGYIRLVPDIAITLFDRLLLRAVSVTEVEDGNLKVAGQGWVRFVA
jgi:hypothetical protein